ncbi:inosine-5'-monophosphate dehydrogenase [Geomicrobium sp. JCM 19037]|uniref:CBS domain-containing protein n=1 Tax=unclassified Geomicrobium TaxID=2628951 RepID=UPI00045F3FAF|nr:CBS domain-containing protein [Geomicrobium sp. JCM 19037]GAK02761.1 inosine-5'-monophosphate dehydrogenase [Geomicrobium sp. JCM 19037]
MNIGFFLLPKQEVKYLSPDATIRQAIEKMRHHRYTAAPLVNQDGKYAGTITEGDLLWVIMDNRDQAMEDIMNLRLKDIPQRVKNIPIYIHEEMEDLVALSSDQNFIPVMDDSGYFIGIVRRRDIIKYCSNRLFESKQEENI